VPYSSTLKFALAALAAIISIPASAGAAKIWVDIECTRVLISADDRFLYQDASKPLVACKLVAWPINTPTASMSCDSGDAPGMEVASDQTLYWNGVEMNAYDGPLPCGANGAEWPD
jgi:hypothetical protein